MHNHTNIVRPPPLFTDKCIDCNEILISPVLGFTLSTVDIFTSAKNVGLKERGIKDFTKNSICIQIVTLERTCKWVN